MELFTFMGVKMFSALVNYIHAMCKNDLDTLSSQHFTEWTQLYIIADI